MGRFDTRKVAPQNLIFDVYAKYCLALDDISGAIDALYTYADAIQQGLNAKLACRAATTTNISLNGTQTVDGVVLVAGDRVLVKNQTNKTQNGIYIVGADSWARASDVNTAAEIYSAYSFVTEGSTNASSGWLMITPAPIVLGTTLLNFAQFSGAGQISPGTGLTKNGNTISIAPTGVAYGTYSRVTVDLTGRVTAGENKLIAASSGGTVNGEIWIDFDEGIDGELWIS